METNSTARCVSKNYTVRQHYKKDSKLTYEMHINHSLLKASIREFDSQDSRMTKLRNS